MGNNTFLNNSLKRETQFLLIPILFGKFYGLVLVSFFGRSFKKGRRGGRPGSQSPAMTSVRLTLDSMYILRPFKAWDGVSGLKIQDGLRSFSKQMKIKNYRCLGPGKPSERAPTWNAYFSLTMELKAPRNETALELRTRGQASYRYATLIQTSSTGSSAERAARPPRHSRHPKETQSRLRTLGNHSPVPWGLFPSSGLESHSIFLATVPLAFKEKTLPGEGPSFTFFNSRSTGAAILVHSVRLRSRGKPEKMVGEGRALEVWMPPFFLRLRMNRTRASWNITGTRYVFLTWPIRPGTLILRMVLSTLTNSLLCACWIELYADPAKTFSGIHSLI